MALVTGVLSIFLFFIIPFSEEPWLSQHYWQQYEEYCKRVLYFWSFGRLSQNKQKEGMNEV
jgi:protein-S-isoprenylcysteine O-methyltransferase Ste14